MHPCHQHGRLVQAQHENHGLQAVTVSVNVYGVAVSAGESLDTPVNAMENVLTLKETVELCRRMSTTWDKGVAILNKLEPKYINEPERILDIGVAKALGIQFRSGYNILRFYLLREEMLRMEGKERLDILKQLDRYYT